MAAPIDTKNMSDSNSDESEETNFLSPKFNPMKALYSSRIRLPFPSATIFNNLREYESVLVSRKRDDQTRAGIGRGRGSSSTQSGPKSEDHGKGQIHEEHAAGTSSRSDSRITRSEATRIRKRGENIPLGTGFRATQDMLIDTWKKKAAFRSVFTRISEYSSGPLSVLSRCMEERCKVRVCTRSFKGLRGVCSGYLVTFDKFFNMALVDVDEVWRRPSTGQRFYHEEKVTFTKMMECFKTEASHQKKDTMKVPSSDNQSERISSKKLEASQKHKSEKSRSGTSEKHRADRPEKGSASGQRSTEHSDKSRERDSHKHRRRKDEKSSSKSHRKMKDSREDPGKPVEQSSGGEEDEDVRELQRRLAALQRELSSLSDQSDAEDTPLIEQVSTKEDSRRKKLSSTSQASTTDLGDKKKGDVRQKSGVFSDAKNKCKDSKSGNGKSSESVKTVQSTEVTQDEGLGQSTVTAKDKRSRSKAESESSTTVKKGRLKINQDEFQKRHVNQLFIRGDNVAFVSVDSNIFPKIAMLGKYRRTTTQ